MDIFDGLHYRSLLEEGVVVGDQRLAHHDFPDHRDIAQGGLNYSIMIGIVPVGTNAIKRERPTICVMTHEYEYGKRFIWVAKCNLAETTQLDDRSSPNYET